MASAESTGEWFVLTGATLLFFVIFGFLETFADIVFLTGGFCFLL